MTSRRRHLHLPRRLRQEAYAPAIDVYNNILNFRGHGVFVPGEFEILKVGKR